MTASAKIWITQMHDSEVIAEQESNKVSSENFLEIPRVIHYLLVGIFFAVASSTISFLSGMGIAFSLIAYIAGGSISILLMFYLVEK